MPYLTADEYLKEFDKHNMGDSVLKSPKHIERFCNCLKYCEGKTGIDVGAAFGHSTIFFKSKRPEIKWTASDFAKIGKEKANKLFPDLEFIHFKKINDLILIERKWDSVICAELIEHLKDNDDSILIKGLLHIANIKVVMTTPAIVVQSVGHTKNYNEKQLMILVENVIDKNKWEYELKRINKYFYLIFNKRDN